MSESVNDTIGDFVQMFAGGITHGTLYFKDHPRVREMAERTVAALRDHFVAAARSSAAPVPTLFIGVARGRLVADGKPLLGALLAARRLIDFLRRLRSGGFLLKATADADQLRNLFAFGHELGGEVPTLDDARRMLAERGIVSIELSPPYGEPGWLGVPIGGGGEEIELEGPSATVTCVQQLHDGVEVAHAAVAQGRVPDVGNLQSTIGRVLHQLVTDLPRALEMAYYADYDRYVIGHSVRVGLFATLVARALALEEARVAEVLCAALLHDVGKARVPSALLYRRGPLSDDEREQMELHAEDGAELLAASPTTTPLMLEVVLAHHVRQDGRGYPALPSAIPPTLWGPLLYVVDVFEALTAVRPYQKRRTPKRAYEILVADRGGSRAYALALFARAVGLHPAGGHVRLAKGEVGRVLGATRVFDRPRVELVHDAAGQRIVRDRNAKVDAALVDLSLPKSEDLVIAEYLFEPLEFGGPAPAEPTGPPVEPSATP
jgi:HD-GYP domain-containing protein (c-di-GMP phosphodiesterase class II)